MDTKHMVSKWVLFLCLNFITIFLFISCGIEKKDNNKMKELDFTVMETSEIPEQLETIIEERKSQKFKLTFTTDDFLYIVVGYGTQESNGYSISVDDLYLSTNAIYIKTNLIGPAKGDDIRNVKSYPYVVVKLEKIDKIVVFE